ncbi:HD domain-containing protein [Candidatus Micrarchaeota archaeon]|nr:HD domain-containing protein [Candidatus Micrarchaeota archaeon]
MKVIRDAIHNNIELNPLEMDLLDSAAMQRLHKVRQLALSYLVYPSALHTRFEHSLGTFHLTRTLSERLFDDQNLRQILRVSALLHDVGHSAFSHLPEPLLEKYLKKDHEKLGMEKIKSQEIASILEKHGVSPKELLKLYNSNQFKIVSSDFGTDRMDYLLRDAYFTGVGYSLIDAERLLLSFLFKNGNLVLQEKGLLAAESLIVSRYLMFNAVYSHHAVRIASEMLYKALEFALEESKITIQQIANGSDDVILSNLAGIPLIDRIQSRNLFKIAYQDEDFILGKNSSSVISSLEDSLSKQIDPSEFVICSPKQQLGEVSMPYLRENGQTADFYQISQISKAVSHQRKASGLIVASSKENLAKVKSICKKIP